VLLVHGGRVFHYVRGKKSGEQRLVAKGSVGIGGHMNDGDEHLFALDRAAYNEAVQREVAEEVHLEAKYTNHVVALINDDSSDVGRVHLGVVHIFQLETDAARKREAQITEAGFLTPAELLARRDALETWSQFCLDGLDRLLAAAAVIQ
jgi:predicted NUDIX family phosphoesterase